MFAARVFESVLYVPLLLFLSFCIVMSICIKLRVVPSSHWKETLQKLLLLYVVSDPHLKMSCLECRKKFQIMYFSVWLLSVFCIRFSLQFLLHVCVCVCVCISISHHTSNYY